MLDVYLLGTGGTSPVPERWLTSCYLRCEGMAVLIDCGEGTQIALKERGLSFKNIDAVLFTHYHADHTGGFPGLLLSMGKSGRTEPLDVYGPEGLDRLIHGVMCIAHRIPFELRLHVLKGRECGFTLGKLEVRAFDVMHSVKCFGYRVDLPRSARFEAQKAKELGIPVRLWGTLQKGQNAEYEGVTYTPDMVLGEARQGIRMVYVTDTLPVKAIKEEAQGADLLIAEGMYGDPEKKENALKHRHMMMQEAAAIAAEAGVQELWLTHYSPSEHRPEIWLEEIRKIFPETVISDEGAHKDLPFPEDPGK
ncbi:MAG: ribonuclease Z [Solobacterium sp.]|nr:ribonuclease Z [Solobacterium sp.]